MSDTGFIGAGQVATQMLEQLQVEQLARDLQLSPTASFEFRAESLLHIVALMQLACRHPALPANCYRTARVVISAARHHFQEFPRVVRLIDMGDDPAADTDPSVG